MWPKSALLFLMQQLKVAKAITRLSPVTNVTYTLQYAHNQHYPVISVAETLGCTGVAVPLGIYV